MKQILLSFRIFDFQVKKYLTPDSKVYIGLDGKLVTPEGPDTGDRYELAHSIPIFDINKKQLFSDDGFVAIVRGEVVYARPFFELETNSWVGIASKGGTFSLVGQEFQILPNAEELSNGNLGSEIQKAWDKKAAEMDTTPPVFTASREFQFGCMKVFLTLQSEADMPGDVWEEHFKAVMQCEEIFSIKKEQAAAEPEAQQDIPVKTPVIYIAEKLQKVSTDKAPEEWEKLADLAAARPQQTGVTKSLKRVVGTNIAAWAITRGEHTSVASDYFVITEKPLVPDENTNS